MDGFFKILSYLGASFVSWCIGTMIKEFALTRREGDLPVWLETAGGTVLGVIYFIFLLGGAAATVIIGILNYSAFDRVRQDGRVDAREIYDPLIESLERRNKSLEDSLDFAREQNRILHDELDKLRAEHL